MKNALFFMGVIIFLPITTFSQNVLPKISPASPEQASLAKFGNYTVNLFHGLPDITIPLYTIKSGDLTLPISISYHSSGIKVNDWGSWVGIGWTLNAGASITRKVMGLSDLRSDLGQGNNFLDGATVRDAYGIYPGSQQTDMDYLWKVNEGMIDAQPDYYYYNLLGKSGMFFFNQQDNLKPIPIPFDPININMTGHGDNFKITDIDGTVYDFGTIEMTNVSYNEKSAWLISQISSSNQQDKINFSYASRTGQVSFDYQDFVVDEQETQNFDIYGPFHYTATPVTVNSSSNIEVTATEQKLTEITFTNGRIVFSAPTQRLDGFAGQNALSNIKVQSFDPLSNTYTTIKSINFYQSYFASTEPTGIGWYDKRLRLDKVEICDKNNNVVEKYQFDYNIPSYAPTKLSKARDFWGYFNGQTGNTSLVPRRYVPFHDGASQIQYHWIGSAILNGRDASSDVNYTQAFSLKRISYPSGGYTDFEYDVNKYKDANSATKYAGGLRIKTIKNYDGINPAPIIKSYMYGYDASMDGFGRANFFDPLQYGGIVQGYRYIGPKHNSSGGEVPGCTNFVLATESRTTWYASPTLEIEPYDGSPVVYKYVTEFTGSETTNSGRTDYEFIDHVDLLDPPSQICYKPIINSFHMDRGQLRLKSVYRKNTDGSYFLLSETLNNYQDFGEQTFNKVGLLVFKSVITKNKLSDNILVPLPEPGDLCEDNSDKISFQFTNYNIRSTYNRLQQTTETAYDESDNNKKIITTTNYSYDNPAHMLPTKVTTSNSKSETINYERKYPPDYPSTEPYITMTRLNILSKVVQEKTSKNSTQVSLFQAKYDDQNNNNYLPSKIDYQLGSNTSETRAKFNSYDVKGNILDMQKTDDVRSSFQWGYNGAYPVAEIKNASNNLKETVITVADVGREGGQLIGNLTNNYNASDSRTFDVERTGDVIIKLSDQNSSYTININYLFSYQGQSGTITLTQSHPCNTYVAKTFTNVPPGHYTLTLSTSTTSQAFGLCYNIEFPIFSTQTQTTGSKDFFYDGFEENSTASTTNPCAGKRYIQGDYTVPFAPPTNKPCYVSYHYLNGTVWKPMTKVYTGVNMLLSEGDGIDEVRVFPNDAQIVTYTYEPLIGITSKCDVNNHLVFYNYDDYGRLRTIKDEDGNILKLISYKYALSNESATITTCTTSNCIGTDANGYPNKKCINGSCETGVRVNDNTTIRSAGGWRCKYHYLFSDGTTLPPDITISNNLYLEINADPCDL